MTDQDQQPISGEVLTEEDLQELNRVRRVDAVETGRPFFTVNSQLNPVLAGYTKLLDYDDGAAKGLVFTSATNQKQYSLGTPSSRQTHVTVVDHPRLLKPIQESGFELANLTHNRGNVGLFALFKHPELVLADTVNWDRESYAWDGNSQGDDGLLHLSVAAWLDARTGKSIRYAVGFFRNICSNGLVSSILGLGHMRLTHNQYTAPKIEAFAQKAQDSLADFELQHFSPKVLEWPLKILDSYQRDEEGTIAQLPEFARQPFNSALASQANWFQDSMMYQMNMALESKQDLSTLDVLNLITNVNREADNDQLMFRVETISESFVRLLEVSAFRAGVEFPNILQNVNLR